MSNHECGICNKRYKTLRGLNNHVETHIDGGRSLFLYTYSKATDVFMVSQHGECLICRLHLISMFTGAKEVKSFSFQCDHCHRSFKTKKGLDNHTSSVHVNIILGEITTSYII